MSIKNLFAIVLKILGIFFIKDILNSIIQTFTFLSMISTRSASDMGFKETLVLVGVMVIYTIAAYFLIFRTDALIKLFKLDNGFVENEIALNMHRSSILSIGIIVIGGYMVVDEIPNLGRQIFTYMQQKDMYTTTRFNVYYAVTAGIKIIVGLLLVSFQRPLVNLIELNRYNVSDEDEEYDDDEDNE